MKGIVSVTRIRGLASRACRSLRARTDRWGREAAIRLAMLRERQGGVDEYLRRVNAIHRLLGIPLDYSLRGLALQPEAQVLVAVPCGVHGERRPMTPSTRAAFLAMRTAASTDGVHLAVRYAYRGLDDQDELIRELLESRGCAVHDLLSWVAAPGYSEHHSGRALDFACLPEDEPFDETEAFPWLCKNAARFGFTLSYPPENPYGLVHEPWHWLHRGE